jgi:hypothetical protein
MDGTSESLKLTDLTRRLGEILCIARTGDILLMKPRRYFITLRHPPPNRATDACSILFTTTDRPPPSRGTAA